MVSTMDLAYLINRRRFRENSFIVDLLTENNGRVTCMVRVAKKRGKILQGSMQPFVCIHTDWIGKGNIYTLTQAEERRRHRLLPVAMTVGLYLNELVYKMLPTMIHLDDLYHRYQQCLQGLEQQHNAIDMLMHEIHLLEAMGISILTECDVETGEVIIPSSSCKYWPDRGVKIDYGIDKTGIPVSGEVMLMLTHGWLTEEMYPQARLFIDRIIDVLLQGKTLHSRRLTRTKEIIKRHE